MTPEIVSAFFSGLNSFVPILVAALLVVVPLFLKLRETGLTVAKIEATTAATAAVNRQQDIKLGEVIDLANGRLEQALKLIAEVRSENAHLTGSILAQRKADEAMEIHDEHKAHADAARAVAVAATDATQAQAVATDAAVAAGVDVPKPCIPGQGT